MPRRLTAALLLATASSGSAQGIIDQGRDIVPVMSVSPQVFPNSSTNTAILSITNGNTANAG